MSAFPTSHFGSTLDTIFRPLVQQIHDCWAELKADSKKNPWTRRSEPSFPWWRGKRRTVIYLIEEYFDSLCAWGDTPNQSPNHPTMKSWHVYKDWNTETSWNRFHIWTNGSQPLRSGCAHALAEQGLRSRSSNMQIKGPIAICVAQKFEAKIYSNSAIPS